MEYDVATRRRLSEASAVFAKTRCDPYIPCTCSIMLRTDIAHPAPGGRQAMAGCCRPATPSAYARDI
eukprot:180934-Rhodomonas_salina.5